MFDAQEELVVDCISWQQAQNLSDNLLEKKLALKIELVELRDSLSGDINKVRLIATTAKDNKLKIQDLLNDLRKRLING